MTSEAEQAGVTVGAKRESVRALLGEPDGIGETGDIWYLGRSNYSVDYRVFHVKYDSKGQVTEVLNLTR
jgi:hypothetical protein